MAGESDDAHVMAEVLAAELCADARLLRDLEELGLEFEVTESASELVALERQRVEVAGRGHLRRLERELGRRAADHDGEVVRRARRGSEEVHLLGDELGQRGRIEECLRLLEQVALVGRAAALRHEEELVGGAVDRGDLDLGRKVRAGVDLAVHVEWCHLRVAQVVAQVHVVHTARDRGLVVARGEDVLAPLGLDDRGARVLTSGQYAAGGDVGVAQQVERHEPIVARGLGVVEDRADLRQMTGAQVVVDLEHRGRRELGDRRGGDAEERPRRGLDLLDPLGGEEAIVGRVGTEGEDVLVLEVSHLRTLPNRLGGKSIIRTRGVGVPERGMGEVVAARSIRSAGP